MAASWPDTKPDTKHRLWRRHGTGKTHLAIAIAAKAVRSGAWARFSNLVDLANLLEQEKLAGKGGRLANQLSRTDLIVLDELLISVQY